jgi:23S rRNA U2552 (ribose-2'-O)-methylase RlmE/FtsJ
MRKYLRAIRQIASALLVEPRSIQSIMRTLPAINRGFVFARDWDTEIAVDEIAFDKTTLAATGNPLRDYFHSHETGRGIWKWEHYFDVYHRCFKKFVGRDVHVLEIGIYGGGSLRMWRNYFGARCMVYGVDIENACKAYEEEGISVFIGDQEDRLFWRRFKEQVPALDIVIDDGGHAPEQQIATLEQILPHLRPGGVYLCEDIHGIHHHFAAYISGLASHFHCINGKPGQILAATPSKFQQAISSIHLYPFVVVIERSETPIKEFVAPKHGTEWQPFL